ncbi:hypothetical protein PsorP6_011447 [Peronosclerospora sorghi]|uniref:Uncharacterized protein n=1 Tax=Peronosclerospora sorghi TaxID=230839 RepID=A0ACC0WHN3_9STRA|nr:hypothetical protein PsorP6_011447 [Peronosclerospora sorghi]
MVGKIHASGLEIAGDKEHGTGDDGHERHNETQNGLQCVLSRQITPDATCNFLAAAVNLTIRPLTPFIVVLDTHGIKLTIDMRASTSTVVSKNDSRRRVVQHRILRFMKRPRIERDTTLQRRNDDHDATQLEPRDSLDGRSTPDRLAVRVDTFESVETKRNVPTLVQLCPNISIYAHVQLVTNRFVVVCFLHRIGYDHPLPANGPERSLTTSSYRVLLSTIQFGQYTTHAHTLTFLANLFLHVMWKRCVLATCGSLLACSHGALEAFDAQAQTIVDGLSLTQVLGQMTQLDLSTVMNKRTGELDEAAVRAFAKLGVGSYLNTYWHDDDPALNHTTFGYTATEFRALIERIQRITMEENGGHPMVYGIDSIHGASYVVGAVLFPHQINCGASFNPALVYEMGRVTARDTAAAGIPWIFGPILDIAQNALWARTYETFGEDPYLASVLGAAYIRGLQSSNHTAACMKHFLGYSKTPTGHDRDNVVVSDFDLLNTFLPPFQAAIEAGALSTMENYISLNGKPVIASARIMNELLRSDLAFDGVAVTDWNEMYNLHDFHRVATSRDQAVALSLRETSIDMSMVPLDAQFIDYGLQLVHASPEQEKRLRDSAKRVVKMKLALGLYSNPVPGKDKVARVGNAQDRDVALNLARESIVLLENQDSVLPLAKTASNKNIIARRASPDNLGSAPILSTTSGKRSPVSACSRAFRRRNGSCTVNEATLVLVVGYAEVAKAK